MQENKTFFVWILAFAGMTEIFRRFPMYRFVLLFVALSLTTFAADTSQRDWKDASGKTIAKGEFVAIMDGKVCIQTADGLGKQIPMGSLSPEDQKFAKAAGGDDLGTIEGTLETETIGMSIQDQKKKIDAAPAKKEPAKSAKSANSDLDITENDVIAESGGGSSGDIQAKVKDEKDKFAGLKRVVMFDFESLWDKNRASDYGRIMGNMFWLKLNRDKGFVIPESMIDVRNTCETFDIHPNPDTPMDKMKEIVTKTFIADIGIWGKIERVDEDVMEIYDFWMKVVDFSVDRPRVIYEVNNVRTDAVAEVTGIYVRNAIEKLYDKKKRSAEEQQQIEENWAKNPNLMEGGDFEKVKNGIPVGWETRCAQHREPIGRLVKRVQDEANPSNHYLHTEFDAGIGEGFGLMYYCKPFPIDEGATYRLEYRYRLSKGVNCIVFVKCYDVIDTSFKPTADALKEGFTDKLGQQTREIYRNQQNHQQYPISGGPNPKEIANAGKWVNYTEEFTPRHTRFSPKLGRVMLYGFVTAGSIDYDDFVLKKIKDADPAELKAKVDRHSLDSKVTMKEMEENERRASEAVQDMKKERRDGPSEKKTKTKLK